MATNFPYFKFVATEWLTGNIIYEDYELQGIFINVCAMYWHRDGNISFDELKKRIKSERLTELSDRFFSVNDGLISIAFLDEQLLTAKHKSKINSKNGKKGGRPKALLPLDEKPNAFNSLNETKAKKSNKEKEKELIRIKIELFNKFWIDYQYKVGKEKASKEWMKLNIDEMQSCLGAISAYVNSTPDKTYRKHPSTYLNGRHWDDEIQSTNTTPEKKRQAGEIIFPETVTANFSIKNLEND
jgi:hypothetical protein